MNLKVFGASVAILFSGVGVWCWYKWCVLPIEKKVWAVAYLIGWCGAISIIGMVFFPDFDLL